MTRLPEPYELNKWHFSSPYYREPERVEVHSVMGKCFDCRRTLRENDVFYDDVDEDSGEDVIVCRKCHKRNEERRNRNVHERD